MDNIEHKRVIYSFLGLPASGKGTQSEVFAKRKGLPLISIGDLVRDEIENEDEKHEKIDDIKDRYDKGIPQEDDVVFDLIRKKLKKIQDGAVFDNFPFSIHQAELFESLIVEDHWDKPVLIYIEIKPETSYERILNRMICPKCGNVYKGDEKNCPSCKTELVKRTDDNKETLSNRIDFYLPRLNDMLKFFKRVGVVHIIDGEPEIKEVAKQVDKI